MKTLILLCLINLSTFVKASSEFQVFHNKDSVAVKSEVFDPEVATQKYLDSLTLDQKVKSDTYFEGGYWLMLWNLLYEIGIVYVFLSLGLSQWVKKIATGVKNINLQNFIYIGFYFLLAYLLTFPLNVYENFFREHQYNLSNLTFGGWIG